MKPAFISYTYSVLFAMVLEIFCRNIVDSDNFTHSKILMHTHIRTLFWKYSIRIGQVELFN